MIVLRILLRQWPLAFAWSFMALVAVSFTRFDNGVAFLWGATAVLIAGLLRVPRRYWWAPLSVIGCLSFLITGFFGLGWQAAPWFVIVNLGEGTVAALIMTRSAGQRELMADLSWFGRFVFAMVVAPVCVAPVVGAVLWLIGHAPLPGVATFISGHALGNLTILPIAHLLASRSARRDSAQLLQRRKLDAAILLPLLVVVDIAVFAQTDWPLLFLPVMFVLLATFRLERLGAAFALVGLALIGGSLTGAGQGPVALSGASLPARMLFFQLFLVATVLTVLPVAADLHHRRKLLRSFRRSEAEFRLLAEYCTDVIMRIAPDGRIRYVSPSIHQLLGHTPEALVGQASRDLIHPADLARVIEEHRQTLASAGEPRRYEYRSMTREGEIRWFATHGRALLDDDGRPYELLAMIRDVTLAKQSEESWQEAALVDTLTRLPNRRALEQMAADLGQGEHCIAILDIDRFKAVNDTHGHEVGDEVLIGFARAAKGFVRGHDRMCRLGGEEFVVLFEHTSLEQAYDICDRLRLLMSASPITTEAGRIRVTISGGVAVIGETGLRSALKSADAALYRAKRAGRDQLQIAA